MGGHFRGRPRSQRTDRAHGWPPGKARGQIFRDLGRLLQVQVPAVPTSCPTWTIEEWRWYIQSLEDMIDRSVKSTRPWVEACILTDGAAHTYDAVNAPHRRGLPRRVYKPDDLLALQGHSDKVNEAIMMIGDNSQARTALRKYYESLLRHKDFTTKGSCEEASPYIYEPNQ